MFGERALRWGTVYSVTCVIAGACNITSDYEICETFTTSIFSTAQIVLEWPFEVLEKQYDFLGRERGREVKDVRLYLKKSMLNDGPRSERGL